MNLVLVDINPDHLAKAQDLLENSNNGTAIQTFNVDVSLPAPWKKLRTDVETKFGGVDLLMLNAAVSLRPEQGKQRWEDTEYFANVHFYREPFRVN